MARDGLNDNDDDFILGRRRHGVDKPKEVLCAFVSAFYYMFGW